MARLLSVNVGLPRDVTWKRNTVRTRSLEISGYRTAAGRVPANGESPLHSLASIDCL